MPTKGTSKCRVWSSSKTDVDPLGLGVLPVVESGFVHLGASVGSTDFIQVKVKQRIDKVQKLLQSLPGLKNPHAEFVLLRSCFSLPKVGYLMRVCSPSLPCLSNWKTFDSLVRDSLNRILGTSLSESAWLQAQLSVAQGGLGLRSAAYHASAAHISSFLSCRSLVQDVATGLDLSLGMEEDLEHLNSVLDMEEEVTMQVLEGYSQKQLSTLVDQTLHRSLLSQAVSTRDKSRLLSVGLPHSGDWLCVVPSPSLCLQLRPSEFRTSVLYRLGMPVFAADGPCISCGLFADMLGDHSVGCSTRGERISRHNHLRDALYHTAQSAHLGPLREERALLPSASGERPADVLLPHHAGGKHEALDICVVSSLQAQLVNRAAVEPGHALAHRYHQKIRKYGEACAAEGIVFTPVAMEVN